MAASNIQASSCAYHIRLDVLRSRMTDRHIEGSDDDDDDDEFMYAGVRLRFWKLKDSATSLVAGGSRYCDICLEAVVTEEEEPVSKIASCLWGLGVPESCHVRVIAELLQYMESEVIMGPCCDYPYVNVAVDIVEASVSARDGDVHEALRRSTEEVGSWSERGDIEETAMRLMVMDIGGESRRGTAAAAENDHIAKEVRRLRRSMAMNMGKDQLREWAAAASMEESMMERYFTPCFH